MDKKLGLEHIIRNIIGEAIGVSGTDKYKGTPKPFLQPSPHIEPKVGDSHPDAYSAVAKRGNAKIQQSETMKEENIDEGAAPKLPTPKPNPATEMPDFKDSSKKYFKPPTLDSTSNDNLKGSLVQGALKAIAPRITGPLAAFWAGLGNKPASSEQELDWERQNVQRQKRNSQLKSIAKGTAKSAAPQKKPAEPAPETKPAAPTPKVDPGKPGNDNPAPIKPVKPAPEFKPDTSPKPLGPPANVPSKVPQRTYPDKLPTPSNDPKPVEPKPAPPEVKPSSPAPEVKPVAPAPKPVEAPAPKTKPVESPAPKPKPAPAANPVTAPAPAAAPAPSVNPGPGASPAPAPSAAPGPTPAPNPKPNPDEKGKGRGFKPRLRLPSIPSTNPIALAGAQDYVAGNKETHFSKFSSVVEETEEQTNKRVPHIKRLGQIKTKIIDEQTSKRAALIKKIRKEASPIIVNPELKNPEPEQTK